MSVREHRMWEDIADHEGDGIFRGELRNCESGLHQLHEHVVTDPRLRGYSISTVQYQGEEECITHVAGANSPRNIEPGTNQDHNPG